MLPEVAVLPNGLEPIASRVMEGSPASMLLSPPEDVGRMAGRGPGLFVRLSTVAGGGRQSLQVRREAVRSATLAEASAGVPEALTRERRTAGPPTRGDPAVREGAAEPQAVIAPSGARPLRGSVEVQEGLQDLDGVPVDLVGAVLGGADLVLEARDGVLADHAVL